MFSENYSRQTALASLKDMDENLSDHDLANFAKADEAMIRAAAAAHPKTPLTTLLKLVRDESATVRSGLAKNPRPDMPEDIYLDLSNDRTPEVIYALIANPAVPDAIIGKLARQYHKEFSGAARERLSKKGGASKLLGKLGIA
ncbi:hypothetical protein ON058_04105 [Demequina sp. B12]|uniref:hypothetical protein n=1 Tax=Demequina sp. B12 TaxID=2992757 RepID=UPI00237B6053|nr:hypothetical protein [Demequina sp. B12]MDE0572594.1 hypothetical protein [Demequina sp. B12]